MDILVTPAGDIRAIYAEAIDLATLGHPAIRRASRVEPDEAGRWTADLSPVGGPALGPFAIRGEALAAEHDWLVRHWLVPDPRSPHP